MPSSTSLESSATSPPQSICTTASAYTGGNMEGFEVEMDELMRRVMHKSAMLNDWQEGNNAEVHQLQAGLHALWAAIGELQEDNKQTLKRINELSAAVAGDPDANYQLCRRIELKKDRDTLVKVLTGNLSATWDTYVKSMPEGSHPFAAGDALYQAAKDAIPIYEVKARVPPRVCNKPVWKTIVKGKAREDKRAREVMEAEYVKRVQEAQEAQRVLALLKNEEVLGLFM